MAKSKYNRKSKKHMRRKHAKKHAKRHTRKRSRKHVKKYKKKGGGVNGPLAAAPFLPPNGPVHVPVPGITNQQDQQYYYAHNGRVVPNPKSTNKALVMKRGGRKSRRKHHKKSNKKHHKKRRTKNKRRRRVRGGGDLKDIYYKTTNHLGSLYSQYLGYGPTNDPPMSNYVDQPIARTQNVDGKTVPMSQYVGDGSKQASKPQFSANYN